MVMVMPRMIEAKAALKQHFFEKSERKAFQTAVSAGKETRPLLHMSVKESVGWCTCALTD